MINFESCHNTNHGVFLPVLEIRHQAANNTTWKQNYCTCLVTNNWTVGLPQRACRVCIELTFICWVHKQCSSCLPAVANKKTIRYQHRMWPPTNTIGEKCRENRSSTKESIIVDKSVSLQSVDILSTLPKKHNKYTTTEAPGIVILKVIIKYPYSNVVVRLIVEYTNSPSSATEYSTEECWAWRPHYSACCCPVVSEGAMDHCGGNLREGGWNVIVTNGYSSCVCTEGVTWYSTSTIVCKGGANNWNICTVVNIQNGLGEIPVEAYWS